MTNQRPSLVMVANWDSDTGYAWWLMESYWACLAEAYAPFCRVFMVYPSISVLPKSIKDSPLECVVLDFTKRDRESLIRQLSFIRKHNVKTLYFSDQPLWHFRYLLFRLSGVYCIVVHDHTPGVRAKVGGWKRALKQAVFRIPGVAVSAVFGASEFVTRRAIDVACVPSARCFTVPNGLPPLENQSAVNVHELFNIPLNRKVLVAVSRATAYKGIPFVIECIAKLVRESGRKDLHLLYCGDGPDLDHFRELVDGAGISNFVTFAGKRADVAELIGGCDFAIQPSRGEVGYSLSILEYMRAGLPVIVPDNPSVRMATCDGVTGLIYREDNLQSAIDAICRLIESPSLVSKLGSNARKVIKEVYSLHAAHAQLIQSMLQVDPMLRRGASQ